MSKSQQILQHAFEDGARTARQPASRRARSPRRAAKPAEVHGIGMPALPSGLTFAAFSALNLSRCQRWHHKGIEEWTISDWAVAVMGEAGEACNAIKKLRRVETRAANKNDRGRLLKTREQAIRQIGEEIADTFIYLDILAHRLGLVLENEVIKKFNKTSRRYGFPEKVGAAAKKVRS